MMAICFKDNRRECLRLIWEKFVQRVNRLLCSVSPQNGAECFNRMMAFSVVCTVGDIWDVLLQLFQDFIGILQLLRGEEVIVEDPVILLSVLVVIAQKIHGGLQQFQ